jgi:KDO2-lipid IV(A) lauroyltransferase
LARRSSIRNSVEAALVRGLLWALRVLPRGMAEGLSTFAVRLLDLSVPKLRSTALTNLQLALPETSPGERERIITGVFSSLARMISSLARFPEINKSNVHEWIRYEGFEHFEAAKRRGKGVLFATGHLGNWELSAFAHALLAEPMLFVVRPLDNPQLEAEATRLRTLSGNRLLGKQKLIRPLLEALRENRAVGILVDQNTAQKEGVFVDFFGKKACVDPSFARIAAHSGAAVIPGFAVWSEQEKRYILKFQAPMEMSGDVQVDTQRVHAALEAAIREHPDQWLWIHRRWKTRPPGEPPIY